MSEPNASQGGQGPCRAVLGCSKSVASVLRSGTSADVPSSQGAIMGGREPESGGDDGFRKAGGS